MSLRANLATVLENLAQTADVDAAATVDASVHRASSRFHLADHLRQEAQKLRAGTLEINEAEETIAAARALLIPQPSLRRAPVPQRATIARPVYSTPT